MTMGDETLYASMARPVVLGPILEKVTHFYRTILNRAFDGIYINSKEITIKVDILSSTNLSLMFCSCLCHHSLLLPHTE